MAHKEWEPDEFLDEFLDFDYKKPVPNQTEKHRGLPAEQSEQSHSEKKSFGLSDEYKSYESLRHSDSQNAGQNAASEEQPQALRSSVALQQEIMEPLSARRAARTSKPAADAEVSARQVQNVNAVRDNKAATASAAPKTKSKSKSKPWLKSARASELASEAIDAAKKLVATDEDIPPEEVPAAAPVAVAGFGASAQPSAKKAGKAAKPAAEKDELAELFAELGETGAQTLSADEDVALRQAQQEAYDRYRGNYNKKIKKQTSTGKAGFLSKWISRIYVVALAAFAVIMLRMDVLPLGMLIAFFVVLGLLSVIIVMQLRRDNVKKGIRALASFTAIVLIACFGLGTAYAMGTLSFLDFTSVTNNNKVGAITKEPFNVCITGIDVDGKIDEQGRSDVNMIVTVNPQTEQILMTSIPRDYQIYMPDKDNAMDKLTHTGFYSVDTTMGAEENLLDTKINYYVKVNFTTVKKFIDAIGGVDVYSEYEFTPVKKKDWTVQEGWNHMNGKQALAFARERKAFIDGDNQRIKNQQAVFEAIIKKATSSKTMLLSYNKILSNLRDYFQMSFSSAELRSLLKLQLAKNPEWKIYKNTIVGGNGSMPTYSTGNAYAYVMTQDETSIENAKTLINAVLAGNTLSKDDDDNVYVVTSEEEAGENGESDGE